MSEAEKSQPSEISIADAAERISALESPQAEPDNERTETADAEVEQTEAALDEDYETSESEDEASDDGEPEIASEDDGESEESVDEDDSQKELTDYDRMVTVKIDGKTEKVTLREAIDGYQRQSDYSRNFNALRQEKSQLDAERAQLSQLLEVAIQRVQDDPIPEPNWDEVYEEDPVGYSKRRDEWRDYKEAKQQEAAYYEQQRQIIQQQQWQQEQALKMQLLEEGNKLLSSEIKGWSNPDQRRDLEKKMRTFGKKAGFSEQELNEAYDPRYILILEKAMKYDELQSNRPKPKKPEGPRPMRAGSSSSSPRRSDDITRMQQRLKSTGRVDDAAALFGLLDSRRR